MFRTAYVFVIVHCNASQTSNLCRLGYKQYLHYPQWYAPNYFFRLHCGVTLFPEDLSAQFQTFDQRPAKSPSSDPMPGEVIKLWPVSPIPQRLLATLAFAAPLTPPGNR